LDFETLSNLPNDDQSENVIPIEIDQSESIIHLS
jgi:hypothetical protein